MALTKETAIDKIEIVTQFKAVQVRTATIVKEDGTELSRSFHRHVIHPDISAEKFAKQDAEVQGVANAVWTPEVKDAWTAFQNRER